MITLPLLKQPSSIGSFLELDDSELFSFKILWSYGRDQESERVKDVAKQTRIEHDTYQISPLIVTL